MKYSEEELEQYKDVLEGNRDYLNKKVIKSVNDQFNNFNGTFRLLYMTLCDNKIITEDPYGEEHDHTKLDLPDKTPPEYNEENYIIAIRLSHFKALLNHIIGENILELKSLTLNKINRMTEIVKFMDWDRVFDPQPIEINTEALNKVLFNYQKDTDQKFAIETLKSATKDLFKYSKDFIKELDHIKLYKAEKYKFWIRHDILNLLKLPIVLEGQNIKKAHDKITEKIREMRKPLYIELIGEVLKEDFTSSGDSIRNKILEKLEDGTPSIRKRKKKEETKISTKDLLTNSITELSKIATQLNSVTSKENENSQLYREEKFNIIEKIIDYIKYTLSSNKRNTIYDIEISSNSDADSKHKDLEFEKFIASIATLYKRLENYKNIESVKLVELLTKEEEDIQAFIHKLISKCRYAYKILSALDEFFKDSLYVSKGIQIELKVILSAIDKSQSYYFEYTKQKSDKKSDKSTYKPDINLTT
ncbi:MAG: hypothetical protein OCD02_19195 [Spirochaetaceae bacterium]